MRTTIIVAAACACICSRATAQEALYVRYEIMTTTAARFSEDIHTVTGYEELHIDSQHLVLLNDRARYHVDLVSGRLVVADREHGTFFQTPLPFDPSSILNAVSALRYANEDRVVCGLTSGGETTPILGRDAERLDVGDPANPSRHASLWLTKDPPLGQTGLSELPGTLWSLLFARCDENSLSRLRRLEGLPLKSTMTYSTDAHAVTVERTATELSSEALRPSLLELPAGFSEKSTITYADLTAARAGPPPIRYSDDEAAVFSVIERLREGCVTRDTSRLDAWVDELLADDVYIVGTDSRWPDTWEWRGGKNAARQMFARDWLYWGDVRIYDEEMHVDVEGNSAWVIAYATVTRRGSDDDRSRQGAVSRIAGYTAEDWTSRRKLYEVIADASQVLAQYERGEDFVTPMRTQFDLVKKDGRWLIKVIHWSHPAYGFRSWRLLNTDEP